MCIKDFLRNLKIVSQHLCVYYIVHIYYNNITYMYVIFHIIINMYTHTHIHTHTHIYIYIKYTTIVTHTHIPIPIL